MELISTTIVTRISDEFFKNGVFKMELMLRFHRYTLLITTFSDQRLIKQYWENRHFIRIVTDR